MLTKQQLDHAYEAGRSAFENHRDLGDCPTFAIGDLGRPWRERWRRGWADAAVKAATEDAMKDIRAAVIDQINSGVATSNIVQAIKAAK